MDLSEIGHLGLLEEAEPPFGAYRYRIGPQQPIARYGVCEVCCRTVQNLYFQAEERYYCREEGWTGYHGSRLYGHEKCLRAMRKPAYEVRAL